MLLLAWIQVPLHCHCFLFPEQLKPIYQQRNRTSPRVCVEEFICAKSSKQALPAIYSSSKFYTIPRESCARQPHLAPIFIDSHTTQLLREGKSTVGIWLKSTTIQYPGNLYASDTHSHQEMQPWAKHIRQTQHQRSYRKVCIWLLWNSIAVPLSVFTIGK